MPMRIKSIINHDNDQRIEVQVETRRIVRRRKGRPHVSSACFHCKKSHLACDRNRPCNRCTSTGKGEECFDTEHKKRGRPRTKASPDNEEEAINPTSLGVAVGKTAFASVFPTLNVLNNVPSAILQSSAPTKNTVVSAPLIVSTYPSVSQTIPEATPLIEAKPEENHKVVSILDRRGIIHSAPNFDPILGLGNRLYKTGSLLDLTFESDKSKLLDALWNQPTYSPTSNFNMELPTTQLCIHFFDLAKQYSLFDVHLSPSLLEIGLIECAISKFEFSTLISGCSQVPQNNYKL